MVAGMNVKNAEPRAGNKHTKTKPTVEAIQMARILEDSKYPSDLSEQIKAVQAVVPNRSEEEICIALHDSDYQSQEAISALLDSQTTGSEWTTSGGGRKGKKKAPDAIDLIVAPGDKQGKSRRGGTIGTTRAGGTRETYGGGVNVKGRGKPNKQRKKPTVNGRGGDAPLTGRGDAPPTGRRQTKKSQSVLSAPTVPMATAEVWDTLPVATNNERVSNEWSDELKWTSHPPQQQQQQQQQQPGGTDQYWVMSDYTQENTIQQQEDQHVFPEAIPQPIALAPPTSPLITQSEATCVQPTTQQPIVQQQAVEFQEYKSRKPRRIARSLIPTIPVEMPQGEGDPLDLQFGSLGIDFGEQQPSNYVYHTSSDVHRLTEDPGVIAVTTSYNETIVADDSSSSPILIERPPGLTHPTTALSQDTPTEVTVTTIQQEQPSSVYNNTTSELLSTTTTSQQQTTTTQSTTSKTVPSGVIYPPPMMPQYPAFMTMYPGPGNYGDPADMSRYQASVSLAYYQQSDPALSAAGSHYSTSGDKFGRADVSTSVSQQSGQQVHAAAANQGGAGLPFMNYTAYPSNMFYPAMYFPQPANPHSIAPKPTSGSSYPGGVASSYQAGTNYSYPDETSTHDYKMYSTKSASKTMNNDSMSLSSYKQQQQQQQQQPHYDGKASNNYQPGFGVQSQQYMAGYMQAMPTGMPLPAPMQPTAVLQDGSQRATNVGGKAKNPYPMSNYWGGNP